MLESVCHKLLYAQAREDDVNGDGKYDRLNLDIDIPMAAVDKVVSVKLLLFFYYKLRVSTVQGMRRLYTKSNVAHIFSGITVSAQ